METNPFILFQSWYKENLAKTSTRLPATCCLSTTGLDGYPNSRFVALKEITEEGFIITGNLSARKGIEISISGKVALSFWWPEIERQIRIQGNAVQISDSLADKYFSERNRDSQIVSQVSDQGKELLNPDKLTADYLALEKTNTEIKRPENWGGYLINPIRIEFLEFKPTRFHDRTLYELVDGIWNIKKLQP